MATRQTRAYTYLHLTHSTCPRCMALVQARVVTADGKVYLHKRCPTHGPSEALVSEDAEAWLAHDRFAKPGSVPLSFATEVAQGCPSDCGLCPDHQQHTCLPIIEITEACNLDCPICMAGAHTTNHMQPPAFATMLDNLVAREGYLETITLSGGEPTSHPQLLQLLDLAARDEIGRISLVTNGVRLARDQALAAELAARNIYVVLQFDGLDDDAYRTLRGQPMCDLKLRALDMLAHHDLRTQLLFVAARGVNEHQLAPTVDLLLSRDHVLSLLVQPLAATGHTGADFEIDPLDRLTIPGAIAALCEGPQDLVPTDFIPLPCSHPACVSLTYLLRLDDGRFLPFPRFVDMQRHADLFQQTATLEANAHTESSLATIIDDLWSASGEVPDCDRVRRALKRAVLEMFPAQPRSRKELLRVSERQAKTIFIHHYMDCHTFDVDRLVKCCHHIPLPDGRLLPVCRRNLFGSQLGLREPT